VHSGDNQDLPFVKKAAEFNAADTLLMLVTALYDDETIKRSYFAGIIAEPPSVRNKFRSVSCVLVAV